jgi:hypothetical protein
MHTDTVGKRKRVLQQDLGEQTAFWQNPEKAHDPLSQMYSAQTPLSAYVPQPPEQRWPV